MKKTQYVLSAFLFGCGIAAHAQMMPPDGPPQGKPPTPRFSQYEDQLQNTYATLHITAAQQPTWQVYENKVHALMTDLSTPPTPTAPNQEMPALQKLQHESDVQSDRLAALEDIVDAAKALYAVLDAKQKVIADRMLASTVPPLNSAENAGIANAAPPLRAGGGKRRRGDGPPQGQGGPPQ